MAGHAELVDPGEAGAQIISCGYSNNRLKEYNYQPFLGDNYECNSCNWDTC